MLHFVLGFVALASLPVRGAWIEISLESELTRMAERRSPCGERGLKWSFGTADVTDTEKSLPVRGAWIEIPCRLPSDSGLPVAPRAGSVD